MTPFEKCPVCGGEIVEKEVEKILRSSNHTEIVKVQAAVCLRCGERLYTSEVIKLFKEIKLKLESKEMDEDQNTTLQIKLDYEVWLLDFLEKHYDTIKGKREIPEIEITSGEPNANLHEAVSEDMSSFYNATIINAMMPFTFMASFKVLDMIFEWILKENRITFKKKLELLNKESNLQLPPLFESEPYLYTYAKALFYQLLPYRHEVVHKNSFSVSENTLTLSSSDQGTSLTLSSKQVACLVRFVRLLVRALVGDIVIDRNKNKLLRCYLDVLGPVHGLEIFNQQVPLFVHVKLTVPKQGIAFPADLKQVRDELAHRYSPQEAVFDLKVRAVDGEKLIAKWYFAPEEVPDLDVMTLYEESHKIHREALVE